MRWAICRRFALVLAALGSGCTFYTSCPTDNPGAGGSNAGGNAGTGSGGEAAGPTGKWVNVTSNLTELESECGNLSFLSSKPGEDRLIASIAQQGLWQTTDGGDSWVNLGQGEGSETISNRGSYILYDPANADTFWESGTYNSGGIYRTDDGGDTFTLLNIQHNDFVSVDFADPDRQTLLASGHEQSHKLYRSLDGGENFEELGDRLPDEVQVCPFPVIIDADTYLLGCSSYAGGETGILRSTDAGESWEKLTSNGGGSAPLVLSDGSILWASEGKDGIVRSEDQGETWSAPVGVGTVSSVQPVELPDGSIATIGANRVLRSTDLGKTWKAASVELAYAANGLVYSDERKAFYVWHWSCTMGPVPGNSIQRYDFDYTAE